MLENVKSYWQTKSYIIPTVEQKLGNIALHTGTNDSNNTGTSEKNS